MHFHWLIWTFLWLKKIEKSSNEKLFHRNDRLLYDQNDRYSSNSPNDGDFECLTVFLIMSFYEMVAMTYTK